MAPTTSIQRGRGVRPTMTKSVFGLGRDLWLGAGGSKTFLSDIQEKPYLYSTWTYACARTISMNLCHLIPELVEKSKKNQTLQEHPVLERLRRPNPLMTYTPFRQAIVLNLLLKTTRKRGGKEGGGQCFIVPWNTMTNKPSDLRRGEVPDQLIPFSDNYFSPISKEAQAGSGRFNISGWRFEIPGMPNSKIDFNPWEIIRIYLYNPYDLLSGAAPFIAAQIAVDQDAMADVYNSSVFENDGRVAGVLSTEQQNLTDDIADIYMQRWQENYGGAGKNNKVAILGNGLTYEQFGLSLADMQYIEQKRWNKDQVLASFGLNKIAVGDYEKLNYATIREGRKLLWYDTYIPLDRIIWESINSQMMSWIDGGKYLIQSDTSNVGALQDDHKAKSEAGKNYVQGMNFPPELAARVVGIPLSEEDLVRWPHLGEKPEKAPAIGAGDGDGDGKIGEAVKAVAKIPPENATQEAADAWVDGYVSDVLEAGVESLFNDLRRFFYAQRNAMQDKVDEYFKRLKGVEAKSEYIDPKIFMLDPDEETKKLLKLMKLHAYAQMQREYERLTDELGSMIQWNATDEGAIILTAKREKALRGINNLTFKKATKQVSEKVRKGLEENWTSGQLQKEIKMSLSEVAGTRVNQATTIARTELGIVTSESRFEAFKAEGIDKHKWMTHRDERVRITHQALNGRVTNVGQPFPGSSLLYPRDPAGSAGEIINCRCVAVAFFG